MKRLLCFVVVALLLSWSMMPLLSAAEDTTPSSTPSFEHLKGNAVQYSCQYNEETGTATISGTVNHDTMIQCKDYRIAVYRVLPGETLASVLSKEDASPVVSTEISVKFSFTLPAHNAIERFSGYAVLLVAPDGTLYWSGDELHTRIPSSSKDTVDKSLSYKGISFSDASLSGNLGAGSTIIPVYMDQLLSKSSAGYLYHVDQGYQYFDKTYVDQLDAMVRSYSVSGCHVYLQLLLSESGMDLALCDEPIDGTHFYMPNIYSQEILPKLSSISTFLVSRYDEEQEGRIHGMILGSCIDRKEYNQYGDGMSLEEYAKAYACYLLVMGASARELQEDLELVIPFSDRNDYLTSMDGKRLSSGLLESILEQLSHMGSPDLSCMTMIESHRTPFGIDETFADTNDAWSHTANPSYLEIDNLLQYEIYLNDLSDRYNNAPKGYLYRWHADESLSGIPLASAYAYGYYGALREGGPVSFVFTPNHEKQLEELREIIQYVDTPKSLSVTKNLLEFFHVEDFREILPRFDSENLAFREHFACELLSETSDHFKGSFSFTDFSTGNVSEWAAGMSCTDIRSGYGNEGLRGVYAQIVPSADYKYGEMIYHMEYPESMTHTPYLEFLLGVTDSATHNDSLYEITVTLGGEGGSATASKIVRAGETISMIMNIQKYHEKYLVEYVKIDIRTIRGDAESVRLWMYGMNGLSTEHSSEELADLIAAERSKIRNQLSGEDESRESKTTLWITLGVLVAATAMGILVITHVRQTDRERASTERSDE